MMSQEVTWILLKTTTWTPFNYDHLNNLATLAGRYSRLMWKRDCPLEPISSNKLMRKWLNKHTNTLNNALNKAKKFLGTRIE